MESGALLDRHVKQVKFLERLETRAVLSVLILCAWLWPGAALQGSDSRFPVSDPPRNDIRLENRVPVPMRDGTILYADVYRPLAEGRYPVLVARTPYSAEARPEPKFFSRRGYAFVIQDVRGRYESEGRWDPFRHEAQDGYDTIEWAARQPWSNGKVGMLGKSYLGLVQWQAAKEAPPHLVTIFPDVASTSPYHDFVTLNGGWRLSFNFGWGAVRQESRIGQSPRLHWSDGGSDNLGYDRVVWHLPLLDMQRLLGRKAQFYDQWIGHPDYDDYWKQLNAVEQFEKITIPVHNFGGWFDIFIQGTVDGYVGMRERGGSEVARRQSRMIVGPWGHGPSEPRATWTSARQPRWTSWPCSSAGSTTGCREEGGWTRRHRSRSSSWAGIGGDSKRSTRCPGPATGSSTSTAAAGPTAPGATGVWAGILLPRIPPPTATSTTPTIPCPAWAATTAAALPRRQDPSISDPSSNAATCWSTLPIICRRKWR